MTADTAPLDDLSLEDAADWLLRLQAEPEDAALRRAFERWLSADATHVSAWLAVQRSWAVTGHLKPASGIHVFPRRRPRRIAVTAAALAACLALVLALPSVQTRLHADQVTAAAENRAVSLSDGSTVTLGGNSAISTDVTASHRRVVLLRGEAHFEIAADRTRPFVIAADTVQVTVIGTAFDVGMTDRSVAVTVASGQVQVQSMAGEITSLRPGDRIEIDRQSGIAAVTQVSPADVGAWRARRLVLHDRPLRDAIAQLDRYHRGEILVLAGAVTPALERQRVSGVFDLDDPARALRAMLGSAGPELRQVTVREITPYLIVLNN